MSSNGTAHVAEEMREPLRKLRAAELSSTERNALVDALVDAVNNHAQVMSEMRGKIQTQHERFEIEANTMRVRLAEHRAMLDAHAGIVLRGLWGRLRWLVTGR
jgi:hypothetical protein